MMWVVELSSRRPPVPPLVSPLMTLCLRLMFMVWVSTSVLLQGNLGVLKSL